MCFKLYLHKSSSKDMIFLKNSLQIKNNVLLLRCQKRQDIRLGYGVMVTLQILVLSFQVRILVAQQEKSSLYGLLFFLLGIHIFIFPPLCPLPLENRKGFPCLLLLGIVCKHPSALAYSQPWKRAGLFLRNLFIGRSM